MCTALIENTRGKLLKKERIGDSREIQYIMQKGRTFSFPGLRILFVKNDLPFNRVAFVLRKKYGNAVERNRAKRILREIYRRVKQNLRCGYNIVFIIYPSKDEICERTEQVNKVCAIAELLVKTV